MPRGNRYEWTRGGHRIDMQAVVEGPWVCDCPDFGLAPKPNAIGECTTCRRPVYDENGKRVTT